MSLCYIGFSFLIRPLLLYEAWRFFDESLQDDNSTGGGCTIVHTLPNSMYNAVIVVGLLINKRICSTWKSVYLSMDFCQLSDNSLQMMAKSSTAMVLLTPTVAFLRPLLSW
jgi:hypothetical protein